MEKNVKHVYIGLPDQLKNAVLWVSRQYRVNPLSHQPGGCDVIVEYHEGGVLGYDWIKCSSKYVSKILIREASKDIEANYENLDETIQLKIKKNLSNSREKVQK